MNELYAKDVYRAKNINSILDFYENFKNKEELIRWAKQVPLAKITIHEFGKGKKNDVIIVVTTDDIKNEHTKRAMSTYKNFHTIFVESNGPFFNYSNSCNVGLRYAAKYKPDWIVLSNNDVYKITNLKQLRDKLRKIDKNKFDVVFIKPDPDFYHSYKVDVVKITKLYYLYKTLRNKDFRRIHGFYKKFNVEYKAIAGFGMKGWLLKAITRRVAQAINIGDFCIFSANFINKTKNLFDRGFVHIDFEDVELSLRLLKKKVAYVDFMIGSEKGATLGTDRKRGARDIVNAVYLDYMIKKELSLLRANK